MPMLIKNARVVSPGIELDNAVVAIEDGLISGVFPPSLEPAADKVFDAEGMTVVPGFIDIHFHGAGGHDAADADAAGLARIAELKLAEGVTGICPTTLTLSPERLVDIMRSVAEYKNNERFAKVVGVHLEGPYLNCSCLGAQNPDFVRPPDAAEVAALNEIAKVAIVSYAPELPGGAEFAAELAAMGIAPSCGHSAATFAEFAAAKRRGLKHLTHFCNQMTPLHHREIGLVGAGFLDREIVIEIICDKVHLCPEMIKLIFQIKDRAKIALITDAMSAAWLDDGDYELGGLPVYVKDGAARLKSNDALAGSTLKFNEGLRNVAEVTGLALSEVIAATGYNQALSLGLDGVGKVEAGFKADITVLDDDFIPQAVFVDGVRRL